MKKKNSENIFNSREHLSKIKPYVPGRSIQDVVQELGIKDCIKMASNENPLGCPVTSEQLSSMLKTAHHYPDLNASDLLGLLSKLWGLESNQFVVGNGSDEILQMLAFAFLDPGDEVVTSWHTFSEYEFVANLCAAETIAVPMTEFTYDCEALADAVTEKTKLIFIANPNNPTGTIVTGEQLDGLMSRIDKNVIVVSDEAYGEYVTSDQYPNTIENLKKYPNLISLRTFSKAYGLAGFRIGYGMGHPDLIALLNKVRQPFNVNSLAIKAAEIALQTPDFIAQSKELNAKGKAYLYTALEKMALGICKTEANFICVFLPISGNEAAKRLLEKGIIVRSLASFGLRNAIRVTIDTEKNNQRFIQSLEECL